MQPATLEACVALASDARGVAIAEKLAREGTGASRVVWRIESRAECLATIHDAGSDAESAALSSIESGSAVPVAVRWAADLLAIGYAHADVGNGDVVMLCPAL